MKIVTAIWPSKHKKGYFDVIIGSKRRLTLSADSLSEFGLVTNKTIDDSLFQQIFNKSITQTLLDDGRRYLSFRPRSQTEMIDYLENRFKRMLEHDPKMSMLPINEIIDSLIKMYVSTGEINDAMFAKWWKNERLNQKKGLRQIAYELKHKGIDESVIEGKGNALEDKDTREIELEKAQIIGKKKLSMLKSGNSYENKQKVSQFLWRRGFTWDTIYRVIDELFKIAH